MRLAWLLLAALLAASCQRAPAPARQEMAFWYWHSPFHLTDQQFEGLDALGVSQIFVRSATFSNDGEALVPILAQRFEPSPRPVQVHLVYNMDAGALKHFESFETGAMAKAVLSRFETDRKRVGANTSVQGLQVDFDVPTRLLPKYRDLLRELRKGLDPALKLSMTSLPTWFTSGEFAKVVAEVDFYAPQFYDTEMPRRLEDATPIFDRAALDKSLAAADRLGRPYYAGISSFGRALLYDPQKNLQGAYMGLSPEQAMRHPNFEPVDDVSDSSQRILTFRAKDDGPSGQGKGWYLVFRLPQPAGFGEALREVGARGGRHCLGAAVFRVSEPGESMVLPLETIVARVKGEVVSPRLKVSAASAMDPWERIERGRATDETKRVSLTFENVGSEPLLVGEGGFSVELAFEPGTILEAAKGQFDLGKPSRNGLASSLKSASQLQFSRYSLGVGEKATLGPILIRPGTLLNWSWSAVTLSGGKSSGKGRIDSDGREVDLESGLGGPGEH